MLYEVITIALAVRALKNKEIKKIILSRPAVEAGENLGFLPGDLKDKIDPYLQPLYDALHVITSYSIHYTKLYDQFLFYLLQIAFKNSIAQLVSFFYGQFS